MRFQNIIKLCLLASTVMASSIPEENYLWGADRMGKMVRRAGGGQNRGRTTSTSSKTSITSKTSSSSTKTSSTSSTSSSKTSSTSSTSSSTSSTKTSTTSSSTSSLATTSSVSSSTTSSSSSSTSLVADASCTNGANTRSCWDGGYSIATDFDQKFPSTGNTVSYSLTITNTTCNQDGNGDQECLLINGQYPGPVITANWGDTLSITVTNDMQNNGTSIHWHGIRQYESPGSDGVNGITECPIAPGTSKTYVFKCTQYGTSWYHSHYSSQYGMGVVGTILINGPATSNYDIDLGTFPITDWYYQDADVVNAETLVDLQSGNAGPAGSTYLINGTNDNGAGGAYAQVTVTPGKKHRLRLINTSVDNYLRVKLDDHPFTVISADFIPVKPLAGQDWVLLGIGQRYDVVFTANQTAGTYWFRAEVATDCYSANNGKGRALFTYEGETVSAPTDDDEAAPTNGCVDLVTTPYWAQSVTQSDFDSQVKTLNTGLQIPGVTANGQNLVLWALNTTAMTIHWDDPTLQYTYTGNTSYPTSYDVIEIPTEGVWTYWILQIVSGSPPPSHPIHLHGHDFFVLGQESDATFDASTASLNFANPPRRDTATLPSGGWLALAFMANNPGTWLMHCHIAWHISEGLGVQFIEAKNSITYPDMTQFDTQCANWKSYAATMAYPQIDSGL